MSIFLGGLAKRDDLSRGDIGLIIVGDEVVRIWGSFDLWILLIFRMLFLGANPKYVKEFVLLWVADRFLLEDIRWNSVCREDL